jgi:hypothetical protein
MERVLERQVRELAARFVTALDRPLGVLRLWLSCLRALAGSHLLIGGARCVLGASSASTRANR